MKKEAVVLGNGTTRERTIDRFTLSEVDLYGCNRVFMEPLVREHEISVTGGFEHLLLAKALRERDDVLKKNVKLFAMNPQTSSALDIPWLEIPFKYFISSGHVWAAYLLLTTSYEKIHLVGMDFGGEDIHNEGHGELNRVFWKGGWKRILEGIKDAKDRLNFVHETKTSQAVRMDIVHAKNGVQFKPRPNRFYGKV